MIFTGPCTRPEICDVEPQGNPSSASGEILRERATALGLAELVLPDNIFGQLCGVKILAKAILTLIL